MAEENAVKTAEERFCAVDAAALNARAAMADILEDLKEPLAEHGATFVGPIDMLGGLNSQPERTVVETLPAEPERISKDREMVNELERRKQQALLRKAIEESEMSPPFPVPPASPVATRPGDDVLTTCRRLDSHKVPGNELNEVIEVYVLDDPGPGGANHEYLVRSEESPTCHLQCLVQFQDGPIGEVGVTGLSNEALLAVVEDRLRGFQSGPFACEDNKAAWAGVRSALTALKRRTVERMARGVEGKSEA